MNVNIFFVKKEDFFKRLELAFEVSGTGQLAKILGVVPTTVSNWKSGRNQPDYETLFTLCEQKSINIHWLIMGEGEMFARDVKKDLREASHYERLGKAVQELVSEAVKAEKENYPVSTVTGSPKQYLSQIESVPLYGHAIAAGHPADSTCPVEEYLDLPKHMIQHPESTYAVKVAGDSMTGAGIEEGDILIVDTAIEPANKSIVIASINGEQTVKRLWIKGEKIKLMPSNSHHEPINVQKGMDFRTQGVVTWVIRRTGQKKPD